MRFKFLFLLVLMLSSAFTFKDFKTKYPEVFEILNTKTIAVVAPSSGVNLNAMHKIEELKKIFSKIDVPMECFDPSKETFHSHNDAKRLECLQFGINNPAIKILWTLRGGYGAAKLMDGLFIMDKPVQEKILVGYSDITALHLFFTQQWGWKTIHGSCVLDILDEHKDDKNITLLAQLLSGKIKESKINQLSALNKIAKSSDTIVGSVTGGNLSIIQTSLSTKWHIQTNDKILFLEDVNIKPYQAERILYHLKDAKVFEGVKAIVLGCFGDDDQNMMNMLSNFASKIRIPVYKTNKIGHEKHNYPVIYNTDSKIYKLTNGTFTLSMEM